MQAVFQERLGVGYERALVPVRSELEGGVRDAITGERLAVQCLPALPTDHTAARHVHVVCVDIAPGQCLQLEPDSDSEPLPRNTPFLIDRHDRWLVFANGPLALRVPASRPVDPPFPGPVGGWRRGHGDWCGTGTVAGGLPRGRVESRIESLGPCCLQWRTEYRWGGSATLTYRARWIADSDTVEVVEHAGEDADAAFEWRPADGPDVEAFVGGGGERPGAMEPLRFVPTPDASAADGPLLLGRLSHISYFNQWCHAWVGLGGGTDAFAGAFAGWGGLWERRGEGRAEIWSRPGDGAFLRFPVRRGRRFYGLLFSTRSEAGVDSHEERCLLNRRKTQRADLPPAKVQAWQLDPPVPSPRLRLLADADAFREAVATDPQVTAAFDSWAREPEAARDPACAALAHWAGDHEAATAGLAEAIEGIASNIVHGYECVIIFDGRRAKRLAYDLDVLWSTGALEPPAYRKARETLLALAYVFADPDYCRYDDFWPERDPAEGMATALRDEMGDCPVPPNFASEFFSTTAVLAELFDEHPLATAWRHWALAQTDLFLDAFFAEDGTYCESVNYHTHAVTELLCAFHPLRLHGVRDYFLHPRILGSFQHFLDMRLPRLQNAIPPPDELGNRRSPLYAAWQPCTAQLPANGNSGGHGAQQPFRGELTVAAAAYRDTRPRLAGQLMHAWHEAGKPVLDISHPMLTMLSLDPRIPAAAPPWTSVWRRTCGVVSKAVDAHGQKVWCLFRAGSATHHMDFDQGAIQLAVGDQIVVGDHGYHTADHSGTALHAAATWLHSTVSLGERRHLSSGYTGLECAPDPLRVHLCPQFDWCVHRIVNSNFRDLAGLSYCDMIPCPEIVHTRHYLFAKPDLFLLWDTFETPLAEATFRLHTAEPLTSIESGPFVLRTGPLRFAVQFLCPPLPRAVENRPVGPLHSFAVCGPDPTFLVILTPYVGEDAPKAEFGPEPRTVIVRCAARQRTIRLPPPGNGEELPRIQDACA